ncbi:MAG: type II toxin-antitoxin system RelE/ParE family toxin [Phycisphaerae bacterium]
MKRTFVEFAAVTRVLKAEGVPDDAVRRMQRAIMDGSGDLVKGTGGLRKIRCAAEGRGKSGGVRVIFADYPEAGACLLVAALAKHVKENLGKAEQAGLATMKAALDRVMKQKGN